MSLFFPGRLRTWPVLTAFFLTNGALADELPRTRWQVLPLSELFYGDDDKGGHVVTAAFDLPCGATPLGALLVDRGERLQVAAMVARPLAACARLPLRRYFKLPFINSTAWKVIEPMRGDLDGIRVSELNVTSVGGRASTGTRLNVEVPCGVIPAGMLVMPDPVRESALARPDRSGHHFQLAAVGFKMAPRRFAAACPAARQSAVASRAVVRVGGLSNKARYRVMPRKVADVRKLGVLQLRGVEGIDKGRDLVRFKHRCYEVPVGLALVNGRGGQAVAVAVASYINAPCLARQAQVSDMPLVEASLPLAPVADQGRMTRGLRAMETAEIRGYQLGQLLVSAGVRGDLSGIVMTTGPLRGAGMPRGWFRFTARSSGDAGRAALRTAGFANVPEPQSPSFARGRPLRLQITSAL